MRSRWRELLETLAVELAGLGRRQGASVEPGGYLPTAVPAPVDIGGWRGEPWGGVFPAAVPSAVRLAEPRAGAEERYEEPLMPSQEYAHSAAVDGARLMEGIQGRSASVIANGLDMPDGFGAVPFWGGYGSRFAATAAPAPFSSPPGAALSFSARRKGEGGAETGGGMEARDRALFLDGEEAKSGGERSPGGAAGAVAALDRAFQRDARRYDGGFTVY